MAGYGVRCPRCGSGDVAVYQWGQGRAKSNPRLIELAGGVRVPEVGEMLGPLQPDDLGEAFLKREACGNCTTEQVCEPSWVAQVP